MLPRGADEFIHNKLQQLLATAEEAIRVQELVDVAFQCSMSGNGREALNSHQVHENLTSRYHGGEKANAASLWS